MRVAWLTWVRRVRWLFICLLKAITIVLTRKCFFSEHHGGTKDSNRSKPYRTSSFHVAVGVLEPLCRGVHPTEGETSQRFSTYQPVQQAMMNILTFFNHYQALLTIKHRQANICHQFTL